MLTKKTLFIKLERINLYDWKRNKNQKFKNSNIDIIIPSVNKYKALKYFKIRTPRLVAYSEKENYILQEYIEGENFQDLLKKDLLKEEDYLKLLKILKIIYGNNISFECSFKDFIIKNNEIFYVNYVV